MTGIDLVNVTEAIATHGAIPNDAYQEACIKLDALSAAWSALALVWGGDENVPADVRAAILGLRRSVWFARIGGAK